MFDIDIMHHTLYFFAKKRTDDGSKKELK